jgi:hypothetical protein
MNLVLIEETVSSLYAPKAQANNSLGEATCQQLLEGNAEIAIKRTALKKKRKQLVEFSRVLDQLNREIYGPEVNDMEDVNDDGDQNPFPSSQRPSEDILMSDGDD